MTTVSSNDKSLLLWKHNINKSCIFESCIGGDPLFLKRHFSTLFRKISILLKEKVRASFVDTWQRMCDESCKDVAIALGKHGNFKQDDIARVIAKFRGNCGEILVEMLAEKGILDFIEPGSYVPVDPENERFVDGEGLRNGLPVGIQVKNYSKGNLVGGEVLVKAAAMSDLWLRHDRKIKDEDILEFLKSPCQYIVSMTDIKNDALTDRYLSSVVFLGPKWLDMKKIQGSVKTGENAKWKMFEQVADEIDSFHC